MMQCMCNTQTSHNLKLKCKQQLAMYVVTGRKDVCTTKHFLHAKSYKCLCS